MQKINYNREDIIRRAGDKLNLTHNEMKLIFNVGMFRFSSDKNPLLKK